MRVNEKCRSPQLRPSSKARTLALSSSNENGLLDSAGVKGNSEIHRRVVHARISIKEAIASLSLQASRISERHALADRGARFLIERDGIGFANVEWSRKNRAAGRPFIEHQLELMDFYVALPCATRGRADVRLIHPNELVAEFPDQTFNARSPFALRATLSDHGALHDIGIVPDLAFGLMLPDGSRRYFVVEIDRGTMPIRRSDVTQTSFERKMRAYLTAHAAKQHEKHFGWNTFRELTITTDHHRTQSMKEVLRALRVPHSLGAQLFIFATRNELRVSDPLTHTWHDGAGKPQTLIKNM